MIFKMPNITDKRRLESILLVFLIAASSIVIVIPLTAPSVKAYDHLSSAAEEDGNITYDADGVANGIVVWYNPGGSGEDHILTDDYVVEAGYTLDIPPMDFTGDPDAQSVVYLNTPGFIPLRIDVFGTLITNPTSGNPWPPYNAFMSSTGGWDGIYFHPGSQARIVNCWFKGSQNGLVFTPGSEILSPGISSSTFDEMDGFGVRMARATGFTNIRNCFFDDTANDASRILEVADGSLNITGTALISHGDGMPQFRISNATVFAENDDFAGASQSGNLIHIEGYSNDTVLRLCDFNYGGVGDYYIRTDGGSPFIDNCTFETKDGQLTVLANEDNGVPAHPIIRNGSSVLPGFGLVPFDNSTINATGASSVTLEWYMHVKVKNPLGHAIDNAPVWVKDRNGDPAIPPSQITDIDGWARWFLVTELIQYNGSRDIFDPFNVSAMNHSVMGYAIPQVTMNMSKAVNVTIPFSQVPNTPPTVWVYTPIGTQGNLITIDFILNDPDPGDDGNMSISVEYSTDGSSWDDATTGSGSDVDLLDNNTLYHFVWDSIPDIGPIHSTTVYIRITPVDRAGNGTKNQTGSFTVDNAPPVLSSGPDVDVTNQTAIINWTVDESADASVWYGLDGTLTDQESGSTGSTSQSVTLTDLEQGRRYSYILISTDQYGNQFTSIMFVFETKVHIQLYKGWNMISIPALPVDPRLEEVFTSILGQYDAVQWYNPEDPIDPWKHNRPGKTFGNDLDAIEPRMGLWVHMIDNAVLILDLIIPDPISIEIVPLFTGWNLVGYPSVTTRDVTSALDTVPYDKVMTYDASTGEWLSYDPGTGLGDLTEMELGHGYYIHVNADFFWENTYV
ncbi:MAG: hypothetical protein JSW00_11870 [Thermoplasmata archaeon]|nr:MAG: hypothetical protein JSW00_11870 [Thermoplasmata archaeon]